MKGFLQNNNNTFLRKRPQFGMISILELCVSSVLWSKGVELVENISLCIAISQRETQLNTRPNMTYKTQGGRVEVFADVDEGTKTLVKSKA